MRRRRQEAETLEVRALLSTITVTSLADNTEVDGEITLREAIIAANEDRSVDGSTAGDGDDTINFAGGLAGGTINLSNGQLVVSDAVTIDGPSSQVYIDARGNSRIFKIEDVERFRIQDLRLLNGRSGNGGAIYAETGNLVIRRSRLIGNVASKSGGAIYVRGTEGTVRIEDSRMNENEANVGAVMTMLSSEGHSSEPHFVVELDDVVLRENAADEHVFAVDHTSRPSLQDHADAEINVADSIVTGNVAGSGDVLPRASVTGTRFINNSGVNIVRYSPNVTNSEFIGNRATRFIADLYDYDGRSRLADTSFENNDAASIVRANGYCHDDDDDFGGDTILEASRVTVTGNRGHAIDASKCGYVEMADSVIRDNVGRGVEAFDMTLLRTTVANNTDIGVVTNNSTYYPVGSVIEDSTISGNRGGGIAHGNPAALRVLNSTISANERFALINSGPYGYTETILRNSTITGNFPTDAAAVRSADASLKVHNSIISGNVGVDGEQYDVGPVEYLTVANSLIGSNRGNGLDPTGATPNEAGNLIGTAAVPIDARLGALADNGGPTQTHALIPNSPAIDRAIEDSAAAADQNGRSRPVGSAPDMGAFEFDPALRGQPKLVIVAPPRVVEGGDIVVRVSVTDLPTDVEEFTATVDVRGSGAAAAEIGEDLTFSETTLTFGAEFPTVQYVTITIMADNVVELDEAFEVYISETTDFSGEDAIPRAIEIENDDTTRIVGLSELASPEGGGAFNLRLRLNNPVDTQVLVQARTRDGLAMAGSDYVGQNETLEFSGAGGQELELSIPIVDDADIETLEWFFVDLSLTGETFAYDELIGTPNLRLEITHGDVGVYLDDSELVVVSNDANDVVLISKEDDTLVVDLNGHETTWPADQVDRLQVQVYDGNDSVVIESAVGATVNLGAGDDTLVSGSGDDSIDAGDGADSVAAGAGHDFVRGRAGNDTISGGGGNDRVLGDIGQDFIRGEGGDDRIWGGSANDSILGGRGEDQLVGGTGSDTIRGDIGADSLWGGAGGDLLAGGADNDRLLGGDDDDSLNGGTGNDTIQGEHGDDHANGGSGDDNLRTGTAEGADTLRGGDGNDTLASFSASESKLFGEDGDDRLTGRYADGGAGNDRVNGTFDADTLIGGPGDDTLNGQSGSGEDQLLGGDGNDLLIAATGPSTLNGQVGDDTLVGSIRNDLLIGGSGNDLIDGGQGDDSLLGGSGSDTLNGEVGNDTLLAGSGDDQLIGESGADSLRGGTGNDHLDGGDDDDRMFGEDGDDILEGGDGADLLIAGNDNDLLIGDNGGDTLNGGFGSDILFGGGGSDLLEGSSHKDALFGGVGADTLSGGGASDLLNASVEHLLNATSSFFESLRQAWHSSDSYEDRVAATTALMDATPGMSEWKQSDSATDVFASDPGLDWLHADSEIDQFDLKDDELFIELNA